MSEGSQRSNEVEIPGLEIHFKADFDETVDLILGSVVAEIEKDMSGDASLRGRGFKSLPEPIKKSMQEHIDTLLRSTSQGAALEGVKGFVTTMRPDKDDLPAGAYGSGSTIMYQISGEWAEFDVGAMVNMNSGWGTFFAPASEQLLEHSTAAITGGHVSCQAPGGLSPHSGCTCAQDTAHVAMSEDPPADDSPLTGPNEPAAGAQGA